MKKTKFFYYLITLVLFIGCSSDDSTSGSDGNIVADFSFTSDGSTFTFTNLSEGATSYKWDFGDLYFYSNEENPVYTYNIIGGELTVSLTATNEAGDEAFMTKGIVAPVVINASIDIDGDFEDWDEVPVSNEFPEDNLSIKKMKFYTKGPNIDIYFEGGTNMTLDVVDMLFNTDENSDTGYNERWSLGADYLFEGPPVLPTWGSFYSHAGGGGGFSWNAIGLGAFETSGVVIVDNETNAIEMRIPKSFFGTIGDSIDFGMWVNWGAEFYPDETLPQAINIKMN